MKKILLTTLFLLPLLSFAQIRDYTPLADLPKQLTGGDRTVNINEFIPNAITLGIGIAGALAVIAIMVGGFQYITTDAYAGKGEAKETIRNALVGLLLAIGAYVILYTINPRLVKFEINIKGIQGYESISTSTLPGTLGNLSPYDTGCTSGNCGSLNVSRDGLPVKMPGACSNTICYLDIDLIDKLIEFNKDMVDIEWQITEAFPPTVEHKDRCHKPGPSAGTCVDLALRRDTSIPTIKKLFDALKKQGLTFQYEVCGSRYTQLKSDINLDGYELNIVCNTASTGEHAHVEL